MSVVLRAPAHNADLGMWFFESSRDISPDLGWGVASRTIYPYRQTGSTPLPNFAQTYGIRSSYWPQATPVRMSPHSNVTAATESRPRARLGWARAHTYDPCRASSWGHCSKVSCGQTTIQAGTSCWGSACKSSAKWASWFTVCRASCKSRLVIVAGHKT